MVLWTLCLGPWAAPSVATGSAAGVVVEEVAAGTSLALADLQPGDILLRWELLPGASNLETAQGEIRSVFDWHWLEIEQAPRGRVRLHGQRHGLARAFEVPAGLWQGELRARMPEASRQLYLRGREQIEAGDLAAGLALWERAAESAGTGGDEHLRCWLYLKMGIAAWGQGRDSERAHAAYRTALAQAREPAARAAVWDAVGKTYETQNDFARAESSYRSAREIRRATWGESLSWAQSQDNLAVLAWKSGRLEVAEAITTAALEVREKLAPRSLAVASSVTVLGLVAYHRGDLELVEDHVRSALVIQEELAPESLDVASNLDILGALAAHRDELDLAASYHERALAMRERLAPESLDVAASLNNLGDLAYERGDLQLATKHLLRALEIKENLDPEGLFVARSLFNLGTIALGRGELDDARDDFQRSLAIQQRLAPGSLHTAVTLSHLGRVAWARGEQDLAVEYHQRALTMGEELIPGSLAVADILSELGNIARHRGELDEATTYFTRCVEVLEAQIGKLGGSQDNKADFRARYRQYYRNAIEVFLETERHEDAFALLERSRAQSFLAMLAERDLAFSADVPDELEARRKRLIFLHDQAQRQLGIMNPVRDPESVADLRRELDRLRRERDDVAAHIRRHSPRLAELQYPRPLDVEGARQVLEPGTLLLAFSLGRERGELFVLSRDGGLDVHPIRLGEDELRREVGFFLQLMPQTLPDSRRRSEAMASLGKIGRRLYRVLVEPAATRIEDSERLLLVADGPLHRLPFAALSRETAAGRQYLGEWKPLVSVLSATVYAQLRRRRPAAEPPMQLTAFGDPHLPRQLAGAAAPEVADVRLRAAVGRGLDFTPLPASRREVEAIAGLYPSDRRRIFLGRAATEERAKLVGGETRRLHFATHGFIDGRFPLNSGLVLNIPAEFHEGRDNGLLQAWEIFEDVRLDADLVVLSACRSALGREQGGEGLIGLTRAFQYAGARTVAATLWEVDDEVTAELMLRFYRHLAAGRSKDEALRAAQIELIRSPISLPGEDGQAPPTDASSPYYWAAFQLYGDGR